MEKLKPPDAFAATAQERMGHSLYKGGVGWWIRSLIPSSTGMLPCLLLYALLPTFCTTALVTEMAVELTALMAALRAVVSTMLSSVKYWGNRRQRRRSRREITKYIREAQAESTTRNNGET